MQKSNAGKVFSYKKSDFQASLNILSLKNKMSFLIPTKNFYKN